jgi:hypothetical protein
VGDGTPLCLHVGNCWSDDGFALLMKAPLIESLDREISHTPLVSLCCALELLETTITFKLSTQRHAVLCSKEYKVDPRHDDTRNECSCSQCLPMSPSVSQCFAVSPNVSHCLPMFPVVPPRRSPNVSSLSQLCSSAARGMRRSPGSGSGIVRGL